MRNRPVLLLSLLVAAVGGVVAWQRHNETPPTAPSLRPSALRPSALRAAEPFMDPAAPLKTAAPAPVLDAAPLLTPDVLPDPVDDPLGPQALDEVSADEVSADEVPADVSAAEADTPVTGTAVLGTPLAGPGPLPTPPRASFADAPTGPADDLKRISGVGPKLERLLNEQGITTFAQLATLDAAGIDRLQARLPQFPGRIERDDWVGQASRLAG